MPGACSLQEIGMMWSRLQGPSICLGTMPPSRPRSQTTWLQLERRMLWRAGGRVTVAHLCGVGVKSVFGSLQQDLQPACRGGSKLVH